MRIQKIARCAMPLFDENALMIRKKDGISEWTVVCGCVATSGFIRGTKRHEH